MTPFIKRNLLIPVSAVLYAGILMFLVQGVSLLEGSVQHLELLVIGGMIALSLIMMLFWCTLGVLGGMVSFLAAMILLYRPLTDLNPYYYGIFIVAFFFNSFSGYSIYRKISISNQEYTVTMEKVQEDTNLISNHKKNRDAEVEAMDEKVDAMLDLKEIADTLSVSLSEEEVTSVIGDHTFEIFGKGKRVLIYMVDETRQEMNLVYTAKADGREPVSTKKGGIFDRWVLKNLKSLLVRDVKSDFRFSSDTSEEGDLRSLMIKPLVVEGNVVGLLRVDSRRESDFGQHELRILDIIGELGAVAIENARLYCQTEELAIRDSLTGLYVRRYFMERLEEEFKRALRSDGSFAMLMMDIDDFKGFNDKHGHISGDVVLKNIGKILASKASAGDLVGRYGGEEFVFVALNCDLKKAKKLAEDIRRDIESTPIVLRREKCSVTVSIGLAMFPGDAKLKEDMIWEADRRLYTAKSEGKNRVCSG